MPEQTEMMDETLDDTSEYEKELRHAGTFDVLDEVREEVLELRHGNSWYLKEEEHKDQSIDATQLSKLHQ